MNFDQSTYSIDEDKGSVQLLLELSGPSETRITIRVFSTDGSATGKDLYSLTAKYYYNIYLFCLPIDKFYTVKCQCKVLMNKMIAIDVA